MDIYFVLDILMLAVLLLINLLPIYLFELGFAERSSRSRTHLLLLRILHCIESDTSLSLPLPSFPYPLRYCREPWTTDRPVLPCRSWSLVPRWREARNRARVSAPSAKDSTSVTLTAVPTGPKKRIMPAQMPMRVWCPPRTRRRSADCK